MFLKEREEYVLRELAGGKTQSAIARELGVSGARIGQIKAKAIRKLQYHNEHPEDPTLTPDMSVEDLWLSIRAGNCLRGAGIKTVSELVMKTQEELLGIRNFGRKCLYEVKEAIKGYHD